MGRAQTRTYLPLDRWAAVLGIEPHHFNGVTTTLKPTENCGEVWWQYAWQHADRVGREDVAIAIAQAESDIIEALGFFPVPDWTEAEIVRTSKPSDVMLPGNHGLYNARALFQSIHTQYGHVIRGGVRASTLIGTALRTEPAVPGDTMTLLDLDGDGYDETVQIVLATTVTDVDEIRCYFHGETDDEWEIRPLRSVTIAGGNVTILFDKHLIPHPALWEALDPAAINGDDEANFELEVDVYRVYNDPSDQAELQWEAQPGYCGCGSSSCETCTWAVQTACLQTRDPRLGIITYRPATWDTADEEFDSATLAICRQPDRVSLNYQSGYRAKTARPYVQMDPMLERIITYYSVTLLDRPICNCNNVESFINRWREDHSLVGDAGRYQATNRILECPWGTREGALWAWQQVQKYAIGRSVEL